MIAHYYNEFDPYAAQWLRNLMAAGQIPAGEVDERSIVDVQPDDLRGFRQCHFFAGIGGWALAARLAGWPPERELWSGSCPCQPFSVIGQQRGTDDERHLWPHQLRLIGARGPAVWMGEQVAAAVGKHWLDGVLADLERIGYAGGAVVIPACAVDSPHRRDRLYLVADRGGAMGDSERAGLEGHAWHVDPAGGRTHPGRPVAAADGGGGSAWSAAEWITGHDGKARRVKPGVRLLAHGLHARVGRLRAYGNAIVPQVAAEVIAAYMECRP